MRGKFAVLDLFIVSLPKMAAIVTRFGVDGASLILLLASWALGPVDSAGKGEGVGGRSEFVEGLPRRRDVYAAGLEVIKYRQNSVDMGFHDFAHMRIQ